MRVIRSFLVLTVAMLVAQAMPLARAEAQTPSAAIDDVSIDTGLVIYRIKRIELFGSTLSAADLRQLFDANDSRPAPDRLRTLSAERIVAPEIVAEMKAGPPGQSVTYRNLVLTGVKAGHVADASAQGIAMAV